MENYLIIGGSSGIGKEVVNLLSKEKCNVFATYNSNKAESFGNIIFSKLDVLTDSIDIESLPDEIHGLVYCPGTINLKAFHHFNDSEYLEDFKLQVLGATKIIRELLPRLKKSKGASIVLFSTIAVKCGFSYHTQVSISKGAIEGLTKSLSAELAPNIRVNAVAPSLTNTNLANKLLNTEAKIELHANKNPLKKVGDPKTIAESVVFLLTQKSSWITGQILNVDGGYSTIKQ